MGSVSCYRIFLLWFLTWFRNRCFYWFPVVVGHFPVDHNRFLTFLDCTCFSSAVALVNSLASVVFWVVLLILCCLPLLLYSCYVHRRTAISMGIAVLDILFDCCSCSFLGSSLLEGLKLFLLTAILILPFHFLNFQLLKLFLSLILVAAALSVRFHLMKCAVLSSLGSISLFFLLYVSLKIRLILISCSRIDVQVNINSRISYCRALLFVLE